MRPIELEEGAERLHRLTRELIRRDQFRDWNQICWYGISISQSHILDVLAEESELPMQALARRMFKSRTEASHPIRENTEFRGTCCVSAVAVRRDLLV